MTDDATCGRCRSPFEREDLRCPICGMAAPAEVAEDVPEAVVEVLRCDGCGAAVSYDITARAPRCAFCGSVTHLEVPGDPVDQAEEFVPFTVHRERAEQVFRDWLGNLGWFRPSDLRSASRLETMRPLMWVGWVFDADALVSWTADSDVGTGRADWAPHSGQTEMVFDDIIGSASRGLTDSETSELMGSYDLSTAAVDPPDEPPDAVVEQFELPRSSARRQVRILIRQLVAQRLENGHIPGSRFRNLNTSIVLRSLTTRRVAFPAWVIAYRYRRRLFRFVLSGQDADCLMGEAPLSTVKIVLAILGAIAALALLVALF